MPINLLKATAFAIVFLLVSSFLLSYFKIFDVWQFLLPASRPREAIEKEKESRGIPSSGFTCPVSSEFCKKGEKIVFGGNPAIGYNLPVGVTALTIAKVVDLKQFSSDPTFQTPVTKGIWQTSIIENSCYTISYVFPGDSDFNKGIALGAEAGKPVGFAHSGEIINVEGKEYNFILQIQERDFIQGRSEVESCGAGNLQTKARGAFLDIDPEVFK